VCTGVAVRTDDPQPSFGNSAALGAALLAADAIYFPDPKLATAGIHFAKVLDALGIASAVAARLRPFPNGAAAMQALARAPGKHPMGCTQVTEILDTPGVTLVGPLPKVFELATVYTAGVCTRAMLPDQASRLAALLASDVARGVRDKAGFEPIA
jgi:molybdate transport system substrate-binding protein